MSDIEELKQSVMDLKWEVSSLRSQIIAQENKILTMSRFEQDISKIQKYLEYIATEMNNNFAQDSATDLDFQRLVRSIDMVVKYYAMDIVNMEEYEKTKVDLNKLSMKHIPYLTRFNSYYG